MTEGKKKIEQGPGKNQSKEQLEVKIFSVANLAGAAICFLSIIINSSIQSHFLVNLVLGLFAFVFGVFFYLSHFRGITRSLFLPFQLLISLALTFSWFYFEGIEGSTALFFFPAIFLLLYTYSGKKAWIILVWFTFFVIALIATHFFFPEWINSYPDDLSRWIDISISTIVSIFIFGYTMFILKSKFDLEHSITLQKNKQLELSKSRFRDIAISSSDWIWEIDANFVFTYCSDKVIEFLGYTPDEMIGKTPFDFMPDKEETRKKFIEIIGHWKAFRNFENWIQTQNGQPKCFLSNGIPIFDEQGSLSGYRGTASDITEQKRAGLALIESESRFDQLAQHSRTIAWETDTNAVFTYISHVVSDLLGYKQDELVGKKQLYDFVPERKRGTIQAIIRSLFEEKRPFSDFETWVQTKDSHAIWVSINGFPIFDANKQLVGYRAVQVPILPSASKPKKR